MKALLVTDTHYGFSHKTHKIHTKFLRQLTKIIETENVDVVIHTGDWICNNQHQLPRTLKMWRKALGDIPILTTWGNHDWWDVDTWANRRPGVRGKTFAKMEEDKVEWCKEHDIHALARNPFNFKDEVIVYGFDGWYNKLPVDTNDPLCMPRVTQCTPIDQFLNYRAYKDLDWALFEAELAKTENPDIKTVCASHFPSHCFQPEYVNYCANPRHLEMIVEHFDFMCVGHSHQIEDFIYTHPENEQMQMRVLNAGTNFARFRRRYDAPHHLVFEVN